jgi:capsular exopolysaccharide synthesis family protein
LQQDPDVTETLQATDIDNLRVLPSGPLPPNPAELLGSRRFRDLLGRLSELSDVVILDSPPLLAVTDAAVLSAIAAGTVLVVNCGETRASAAREAAERLGGVGARVLGVVINRLSPRRGDQYYYYYTYRYRPRDGGKEKRRLLGRTRSSRRKRRRRRRSQDRSTKTREVADVEVLH